MLIVRAEERHHGTRVDKGDCVRRRARANRATVRRVLSLKRTLTALAIRTSV